MQHAVCGGAWYSWTQRQLWQVLGILANNGVARQWYVRKS